MDVMEAIETRLDIKEFSDDPVSPEIVRTILEAGRLAPSGRNLQHWRFILLDNVDDLQTLGELSPSGTWISDADLAIVIVTDPDHSFHEIDAGRALTHMQLAAWEHGVGSRIFTVDDPSVKEFLGLPDELALTAVLGFGYPAREIRGLKDRKQLEEIAYHGRFGEPVSLE